ncbi:hypothetical protein [Candidatus Chrysopegis kryptomonas]|uniref:HTH HARE-type domain-containing protein n=1 Tax=Candidatus Chryseopegocella kryptomonas TaxID=1633643 RepID=A0A0P1MQT2_9BACT|nr:hypothetical protein [Candidatus Chrysopegis kryptomonas]CUS98178.1 hypothetical protein JGI23_00426 [Candidatus Chrysopegis kryptomonas]
MKQYEVVIKVMEKNGGYATLGYLYENVLKFLEESKIKWKTKTPFATIRRIVQDKRFFFRVKPGLWALISYKDNLPYEILALLEGKETPKEDSIHSFYQGLLVQIGEIKGFKTYIPPQDKNKKFNGRTLGEFASLKEILNFTYHKIIRRVKTIDVIWFNERGFPSSAFEIDHTSDFKNSLLKFLELQDFNARFYIVSPKERYKEFKSRIEASAFKPINSRIKFLTYDQVSRWHSKVYELMLIEKQITTNAER